MEWQPIEAHAGYEVSTCGKVRKTSGRLLKQWQSDQGYMLVRLSNPRTVARVHRLVATAFLSNPEKLPCVNHLDSDRANNVVENLEWCTQQQNLKHASDLGRMKRDYWAGRRSPNAAISDKTAEDIRREYRGGGTSWRLLSQKYGISKRSIGRIVRGETYV